MLITHDLGVVAETCERVIVMYAGQIIEEAPAKRFSKILSIHIQKDLFNRFQICGIRKIDFIPFREMYRDRVRLTQGCRFACRCEFAFDRCLQENPELYETSDVHHNAMFPI